MFSKKVLGAVFIGTLAFSSSFILSTAEVQAASIQQCKTLDCINRCVPILIEDGASAPVSECTSICTLLYGECGKELE